MFNNFFIRTTVKIFGALPLFLRAILGRLIGALISFLPTRDRAITREQLRIYLGKIPNLYTLSKIYSGFGQSIFESLNLAPMLRNLDRYVYCPDWDNIYHVFSQNKPVVALSAHTANWDLLAAYIVGRGVPVSVVGREANKASLQGVLLTIRGNYGVNTIWRADRGGLREIIKELRNNRLVSALIDQDTKVTSERIPFFGQFAQTPSTLVTIGHKLNATFVVIFISRIGFQRYKIEMHEFPKNLSIEEILVSYNKKVEEHIRKNPNQWVWFHKRWRTLDNGQRLGSKDYLKYLKETA